ncbi:AraC family transcriptional regulator [Paenibacillus hodogayensis]|uniref:AraC family transcriptional regulator n=1 Tax=Paenibacillus hodogayensis TaxID=279208 RepID=A0ABV5VRJ5_9BACL
MQIRIATTGMELWKIEHEFTNVPHVHDNWLQVTVPIQGTCHFTHERREYALQEGCALVQHPHEEHHFRTAGGAGVIIIQLQTDIWTGGVAPAPELSLRQYVDPHDIRSRFRGWTGRLLASDPVDPIAQQETEADIVAYLHHALRGNIRPAEADMPTVRQRTGDPHLARVLDYIHTHYRSALTLDELAALALQSRYHFIRSFKASVGMSPYQYVLRVRIEEAKHKLKTSNMTIVDISVYVGFSSTSQLHRAFLNAVGMSPELYRSRMRVGG